MAVSEIFFTVFMRSFFLIIASAAFLAATANAEVYKWRDGRGQLHFANSIGMVPPEYREGVEERRYQPAPPSTVGQESGAGLVPQKERVSTLPAKRAPLPGGSAPTHLNDRNFKREVLSDARPVMVDFWAAWCGPCRRMAPKVEELSQEYGAEVKVAKYDVEEGERYSRRYHITGLPTLILFENGKEVRRIVGGYSKETIRRFMGVDAHE